jgi:NAD(P)-dependent dehydrogenase (short-subunit alcohol dehydrogenase family)
MTTLEGAVVLVTGGNRGIGKAIVDDLLTRGVKKVYATARKPEPSTDDRVVTVPLDVTDPDSIKALVAAAPDVTVLVNNAGITGARSLLESPEEEIRGVFETNLFGPLNVTRAFVPVIERNGGGHVLNMHSVLSWVSFGGAYPASKSALWGVSNGLRLELLDRGIGVTGLHVGYVDTDMTSAITDPKSQPEDIAKQAVDGIESGAHEVIADDFSRQVKGGLSADLAALYPQLKG